MAEIRNIFGDEKNGPSNLDIFRKTMESTIEMTKQDTKLKQSIIENALACYEHILEDVDRSEAKIYKNNISEFIMSPLLSSINPHGNKDILLFSEKINEDIYNVYACSKSDFSSGFIGRCMISMEFEKKSKEGTYIYDQAAGDWKDKGDEGKEDLFPGPDPESPIEQFLKSLFETDDPCYDSPYESPYDSEYKKSIMEENGAKSVLLSKIIHNEPVPDEMCKLFLEGMDPLFDLYDQTSEYLDFDISEMYGPILVPRDRWHMGYAIAYESSGFLLLQYIDEDSAKMLTDDERANAYTMKVSSMKSMNSVIRFVKSTFDAKRGKKRAFTVPLSSKRFITFFGEYVQDVVKELDDIMVQNPVTGSELHNFSHFLSYIEELKSLNEDCDEEDNK